MQRFIAPRLIRVLALVGVLVAGFGAGAGYMTYAASSGNTYYACVTSRGDIYRVKVNAKSPCIGNDQPISWNQQGQPGPAGPRGLTGPAGPPGPAGENANALPLICPVCDFSGEDDLFHELGDLSSAYLRDANLSSTNLGEVNLTEADLRGVDLSYANLDGTNLTDASMSSADLSFASLRGATLEDAFMVTADFSDADLEDAVGEPFNLSGAIWSNTTCPDATNSDTNGGTCVGHFLPLP